MTDDSVANQRVARQDPHDEAFLADPYPVYGSWHQAGGWVHWQEYGHWCVASFDQVHGLYRDRRFGRLGCLPDWSPRIERWYETERFSLLALDPPEHTHMRALVNRAFLSRRVEALRPRIARLVDALIDDFVGLGEIDLLSRFAQPLPAIVIAELIGLPATMAPQLLRWSHAMVQMYMHGVTDGMRDEADQAAAEFSAYIADELAARRKRPTDDLLSQMLSAEIDGERLDDAEVIATSILLLNAGHEATVHTTGNAVRTILESGRDPGSLFADDESIAATVEECLRFDPPLHMFTRFALEDVTVGDITIAKGEPVGLLLGAANRDPARFSDPDVFDPFRSDAGHLSFGSGIHFCIGAPLARIELQASLRRLFERLPNLRMVEPPTARDIYHFRGLDTLRIAWDVAATPR